MTSSLFPGIIEIKLNSLSLSYGFYLWPYGNEEREREHQNIECMRVLSSFAPNPVTFHYFHLQAFVSQILHYDHL